MTCTETTCAGSAVGDTKTEQWHISFETNAVIVKAMAGENLVRVYTGTFADKTIELKESSDSSFARPETKMLVRLRVIDESNMEGQREIVRNDCKVIYALQLGKQKP
jgi:hypothetical protein